MQLDNYISDLLYRYECVTVPGFGAFLAQRVSARLDENLQVFFPPKKKLSFNSHIKENDGLLANYISSSEQITYPDALKEIEKFTQIVLYKIEQEGSYTFNKIGALSRNENGVLLFEPEENVNFLTQSFGLASYAAKPVAREEYKKQVATLEEKAPISITPERKGSPLWVRYAAVGMLAIGIAGMLGYKHVKGIESHNFAAKQEAESKLEQKIQNATFIIDNPFPAVEVNAFKPKGKYHVVAGAFRVEENAEKRVEELREKGFKARNIGENRYGLHQVVYGSYEDKSEAVQELRDVRKNENTAAWMLVQEIE